ncbi:MAG: hypothetical protein DMG88_16600 [Acidobacteria bacterium]|nr:MAG: hypothetical protein DMG88_16600 [Acidobacteriota bacterium]
MKVFCTDRTLRFAGFVTALSLIFRSEGAVTRPAATLASILPGLALPSGRRLPSSREGDRNLVFGRA